MKIAYFDCFSGVSGDMILGAMVDAGLELPRLKMRLNQLPLKGFELKTHSSQRGPFIGTKVDIHVQPQKQKSYEIRELENVIRHSRLDDSTKKTVEAVLERWIKAEIKAHGTAKGLRFQANQAIDLLIDIVGCVLGLSLMGIDEVMASPLNLGSGLVDVHGQKVPVPAPTTAELVRGFTVYAGGPPQELTTPTGAAIITTLVTTSGSFPEMRLQKVGYGAGSREFPNWPNMLRMLVGEGRPVTQEDRMTLLETAIDDLNPQVYEHLMERLFAAGALDVYLTSITMKKGRPGILLSALAEPHQAQALMEIVFEETTTLGIRQTEVQRRKLPRASQEVETRFGRVRVKAVTRSGGLQKRLPEYEDCKRIAQETGLPLRQIMDELEQAFKPPARTPRQNPTGGPS
ncbi:MAG: nickel pincer cofactor biosynthesis protein LarC [Nitrospirae bacterium]|nr:nickel pincer cofactor biosynthesis protein LarC [Nitrospirota bacterium]